MKIKIFLLAGSVFLILTIQSMAQNIGLNKSCSAYPAANYPLTKGKNSPSFLTDGVYSTQKGYWTDPKTLGWANAQLVTIKIDLNSVQSVGTISLNTAPNVDGPGIHLPLNALVFLSTDSIQYHLAGDLAGKIVPNNFNSNKLILKNINQLARYITVKIKPNGMYFFCDEIEVLNGVNERSPLKNTQAFTNTDMDAYLINISTKQVYKKFLERYAEQISKLNIGQEQQKNISALKNKIDNDPTIDSGSFNGYQYKLQSLIGTSSNNAIEVKKIDPWDERQLFEQSNNTYMPLAKIELSAGGVQYVAFSAFNKSNTAKQIKIREDSDGGIARFSYYHAAYVRSKDFKTVPDVLNPVVLAKSITLAPGETKIFFEKIEGLSTGQYRKVITVNDGVKDNQLNFIVAVKSTKLNFNSLNTNNWAYYNYPFVADRGIDAAAADLIDHHINTIVIANSYLSFNNIAAINDKLTPHLKYDKQFDNILLFLAINQEAAKNSGIYDTEAWQQNFLSWYDKTMAVIKSNQSKIQNVYLYLFDEINPAQLPVFLKLAQWIRSVRPQAKLYATVNIESIVQAVSNAVDVIQIIHRDKDFITGLNSTNKWIYDYGNPTKSLSPYVYYRLMSWDAYAEGCKGVGFWNYADVGFDRKNMSVYNDFDGKRADYAVVYNDVNGKLLSSRRWEAFKLGIEDYNLLIKYADKFGKDAAFKLCTLVINNPNDHTMADSVGTKILESL